MKETIFYVALFAVSILWALGTGMIIGYLRGRAHGVCSRFAKGSSFDGEKVVSHGLNTD